MNTSDRAEQLVIALQAAVRQHDSSMVSLLVDVVESERVFKLYGDDNGEPFESAEALRREMVNTFEGGSDSAADEKLAAMGRELARLRESLRDDDDRESDRLVTR